MEDNKAAKEVRAAREDKAAKENKVAKEDKAAIRRHRFVYRTAYLATPFLLRKYNYTTDKLPKLSYPCLIMANHLTESDMLMLGSACPEPMYFVAGEHLMRTKFGPYIKYFGDPILESKGASTINTVREIVRRVKAGHSVAIFPEGSRSFNGETLKLDNSIGKLVKISGAGLVTYKITGGYFIAPRWAYHFRKGPASGKIQRILSPEEIKKMSASEITSLINEDLHENAYETQKKAPKAYKGEKLAEGLENYLIICPKCHTYDRMETKDNTFSCPVCGLHGIYTEEGFLEGEDLPYHTVYDWGRWVEDTIRKDLSERWEGMAGEDSAERWEGMAGKDSAERWEGIAEKDSAERQGETEPIYTEEDITLYTIGDDHSRTDLVSGEMKVYRDRMVFPDSRTFSDHTAIPDREIFFKDIEYMNMLYYGKTLLFTAGGKHYGITGPKYHALKVSELYEIKNRYSSGLKQ